MYKLKAVEAIQFDGGNIDNVRVFCGSRLVLKNNKWVLLNKFYETIAFLQIGYWIVKGEKLPTNPNNDLRYYSNDAFPYEKID